MLFVLIMRTEKEIEEVTVGEEVTGRRWPAGGDRVNS